MRLDRESMDYTEDVWGTFFEIIAWKILHPTCDDFRVLETPLDYVVICINILSAKTDILFVQSTVIRVMKTDLKKLSIC